MTRSTLKLQKNLRLIQYFHLISVEKSSSKPRPLDDFYMTNALVDMIALLEAKGDNDSMDKVRRYRRFLAGRNDIPVSGTAKERLQL